MTKLTDRVDVLENESKDEVRETGNHGGGVNIETFNFHGEQNTSERTELVRVGLSDAQFDKLCSGLSDFLQSQRYGPSNYNQQPSIDNSHQEVNAKITKEGFVFAQSNTFNVRYFRAIIALVEFGRYNLICHVPNKPNKARSHCYISDRKYSI